MVTMFLQMWLESTQQNWSLLYSCHQAQIWTRFVVDNISLWLEVEAKAWLLPCWMNFQWEYGSCVLKASSDKSRSIPLIKPWSNLDQRLCQHLIDTLSTLYRHLDWQLVDSWLIFTATPSSVDLYMYMSWLTLCQLLTDSRSSFDRVSMEMSINC